ncbi:P63C domain-containing protein [Zhongshania marina]|uniref:Bacteriophage Mx8 p63 C-terminal domain-containing protein n=1 Tax=Zhongshania marina TaxID=2304603 RepID=A0A2S4HHC8_9GAMM|nr:P63C domain-containing protein [Marortus luteolus]POP53101.1 hypothetical protein C0068_08395 [Marortus luteolus]
MGLPQELVAEREGQLELGGWLIDCHHLSNGRRVITQRSFTDIIGLKRGTKKAGDKLAGFLNIPALKSENIARLSEKIQNPVIFKMSSGPTAFGYEGDLLIEFCKAILEARRAGYMTTAAEKRYAMSCEAFVVSCAKVGIMALIDEATGYSQDKAKDEYRALFTEFIRAEMREWEKEFPQQFFDMIYRLYGIPRTKGNHPQFFGGFIRKYVYQPLAASNGAILEQLDVKNPVVFGLGGRKYRMHQFLTEEIGVPALREHLWQVIGIGASVRSKESFSTHFKRAFPQIGDQGEFDIEFE